MPKNKDLPIDLTLTTDDPELAHLLVAAEYKHKAIEALGRAAEARRDAGRDIHGIEDSIDLESSMLSGYALRVAARRRELRGVGRDGKAVR